MKNDEIIKTKITFIVNYYPKHWNKLSKILETGLLIKLRKSNKTTTTTIYLSRLFASINSNPKHSFVHKKLTKRTVVRYLYLNLVNFDKIIVCDYDVENIFGLFDGNSIRSDIKGRKLISTLDLKPKDLIINWSWKRIDSSNNFWDKKDIKGRILFFTEFPKFIEFVEKEGALVENFIAQTP